MSDEPPAPPEVSDAQAAVDDAVEKLGAVSHRGRPSPELLVARAALRQAERKLARARARLERDVDDELLARKARDARPSRGNG